MPTNVTDEAQYGLIDMATGEITPIELIEDRPDRWDRVYGKALANMLDAGGEERAKVIAYLVRHRDYKNVVLATVREISDKTGVSTRTTLRTLKALEEKNFIHRLRHGVIMFSPHVIRTGRDTAGLAVLRRWKDATEEVCDEEAKTDEADRRDGGSDSIPRIRSNRLASRKSVGASSGSETMRVD